jgi:cobalt-zinc-cadmium efflux system outer membrane protein
MTTYLGVLASLWPSVLNVADFLQTDDFFQMGKPLELPELPDLDCVHSWPCPHPQPVPQLVPPPAHPILSAKAGVPVDAEDLGRHPLSPSAPSQGSPAAAGPQTGQAAVPHLALPEPDWETPPLSPSAARRPEQPGQSAGVSRGTQPLEGDEPADNPNQTGRAGGARLGAPVSEAVSPGR